MALDIEKPPKTSDIDKPPPPKAVSFFKLYSYADKVDMVLMVFGTIGAIVHGLAMPVYFVSLRSFFNAYGSRAKPSNKTSSQYALVLLYLGLVSWAGAWTEILFWSYTGERQTIKLRSKYLQSILRQDIEVFDTKLQTGEVVESICSDTLLVQEAIGEKMGSALRNLTSFLAGNVVGFVYIWQLGLVTLGTIPVVAVAAGMQAKLVTSISSRSQEAYAQAGINAEQAVSQVRTVYAYTGETKEIQAYSAKLEVATKLSHKMGFATGLGIGTLFMTAQGSLGLLLWFGGFLVFRGISDGASIIITIFSVMFGSISLGQASLSFTAFAKGRGAAQKIFTVIEQADGLEKHYDNTGKVVDLQGRIEFKDVDFCYPSRPDVPVLQSFSIDVAQGKTVAIVGSTGSGKSTVVALLERFYEPTAGRILIDGHNINSLQLKSLRLQLGLVSQEPTLFATSIKENIQMGKGSATFEEIELAAKSSNAHEFIQQLPNGYDTQVGEKGIQLSGGQKQRIAIARAVLRNPPILLLDEATSALDSSSEKVVQDALDQFMMGRTAIVIAHRLSTIQNVDTILVLEKGRLIETGTHQELLSKGENGVYYKLVKLQEMTRGVLAEPKLQRSNSTPKSTPRQSTSRVYQVSPSTSQTLAVLSFDSRKSFSMSFDLSEVRPTIDPEKNEKNNGSYIWRLARYNVSEWPQALIGSLGCIFTGVVNPLSFLIMASVIVAYYDPDHHHGRRQVGLYTIYYIIIAVSGMLGYILQEYFWGFVNDKLIKRIRELMLSAILRNEIGWFDKEENSSSQLTTRLALDAANVRNALGGRTSLLIHNITVFVISSIISFLFSWKMTLIALAVFPISILSHVVEKTLLKGDTGEMERAHQKANTVAGEAVSNVRMVAAFNAEDRIISSFEKELHDIKRQSLRRGQISGISVGAAKFFRFCGNAFILWFGLYLVTHKGEDPTKVIKVFIVILAAGFIIGNAISLVPDLLKSGMALASVFQILDRGTLIDPDNQNATVVEKVKGDIELKNVGFHYPTRPEVPVFSILNLRVAAGTSLALVGPSGCGKSTIVGLLQRFYEPTKGRVMVDGVDIRNYNLKSLRKHIGLVQQEPALFATTIYDNIAYGRETVTEAEVEAAAKAANAHNFISALPEGYKTFAGERGSQLSGGQKQRIAIARAVLKDPAILLLDEATSALDAEAEKVVQQALDKVMEGRTVIVIAHRLSTIRNVDKIAVFQDGTVVEQGSHALLLSKRSGAYSRLISLQNQHAAEAEQP